MQVRMERARVHPRSGHRVDVEVSFGSCMLRWPPLSTKQIVFLQRINAGLVQPGECSESTAQSLRGHVKMHGPCREPLIEVRDGLVILTMLGSEGLKAEAMLRRRD